MERPEAPGSNLKIRLDALSRRDRATSGNLIHICLCLEILGAEDE
jgi:hypothetical protein